jgi:hypothetical protein
VHFWSKPSCRHMPHTQYQMNIFSSLRGCKTKKWFPHTWGLSCLWSWDNMIHIRWRIWPISRKKVPNSTLYKPQHLTSMTETHYSQQEAEILPVYLTFCLYSCNHSTNVKPVSLSKYLPLEPFFFVLHMNLLFWLARFFIGDIREYFS